MVGGMCEAKNLKNKPILNLVFWFERGGCFFGGAEG